MDINAKLTAAFRVLRKEGYFARKNFWCCQSCAWAAVPEEKAAKAVFYHKQDADMLRTSNAVYLAWAGNGKEIVSILESNGLCVTWDGSDNSRILVKSN